MSITEERKGREKRKGEEGFSSAVVDFTTGSDWQMSAKKEERKRKGKTNRQAIDTGLNNFVCLFLNR